MPPTPPLSVQPSDRVVGLLLGLTVLGQLLSALTGASGFQALADLAMLAALAILTPQVRRSRQIFVVLALLLTGYAFLADPATAAGTIRSALDRAAFIVAFFSALATLRHVAEISPAITRAAMYLASQPPGRRYTALAAGGHVFALVLNYGSISLLGSMAASSAAREPDPQIRAIRSRRMLQAVHRGFASSLCWSPLSFAMVISTTVVPGANWGKVILPAIAGALILTAIGWGLDRMFKPPVRRGGAAPAAAPDKPAALLPVLWLLLLIVVPMALLHAAAGLSAPLAVLLIVPVVAAGWLAVTGPAGGRMVHLARHSAQFGFAELPSMKGEIVLLAMAGFLGAGAGALLAPLVASSGLDLAALPVWLLVVLPVWLIPLGGQLGMNPILFVSLFGPLLPAPETLGISATPLVLALTGGWAISGVTSPFTASVLLIARLGGVTAKEVSLAWNGIFALLVGLALSAWALLWVLV